MTQARCIDCAIPSRAGAAAAADSLRGVDLVIERGERNSRRLYGAVQIAAPVETVWGALTDYEGLSNFIPGEHRK